jgi:hypothetical protein
MATRSAHGARWNLPSLTVTPAAIFAAVERRARALGLQPRWRDEPDARLQPIVDDWPRIFTSTRALGLGLHADADVDAVVDDYLAHRPDAPAAPAGGAA